MQAVATPSKYAYTDTTFDATPEAKMRTTLTIDDELYKQAVELTGVNEKSVLMREGLKALIERESARRLALLGGSQPHVDAIPRRQSDTEAN